MKIAGGVEIILEKTYSSQVKLEIYDASGKVIRTLNNGTLSPGTYRYNSQTTSVARGVYFVRAIGMTAPLTAKILVVQENETISSVGAGRFIPKNPKSAIGE